MPLKYLFDAFYGDGTRFTQPPDDVSMVDPKRSAFSDVDHPRLRAFCLRGEGGEYGVELVHGHFIVNGAAFRMHEEPDLKDFRLIFFRRHTHTINAEHQELAHQIVYRLGWQATDSEGRNVQRVMEID